MVVNSTQQGTSDQAVTGDNWTGGIYIEGKGTVQTKMFEEKANVCKYFDAQSGLWVLLPLQWEMDIDFVTERVKQVMCALPGFVDQKEITAALRQCDYNPDKVISVYLSIFGDVLFQLSESEQNYRELNLFRSHSEKDSLIEDLNRNLQMKDQEAENQSQRNSHLAQEALYLSDVVQHLKQRVAELETEQQENLEKITALLNHRRGYHVKANKGIFRPASALNPKPFVDLEKVRQMSDLTRELSRSNRQLRSIVCQTLSDMQNQAEKAGGVLEELRCLYRKEVLWRKALNNEPLDLQVNIQVFCRCRRNSGGNSCLYPASDQELLVHNKGTTKKFLFDKVFPSSTTQEEVFDGALPIITSCVFGYRVCILAYGQTGSGKTFTVSGTKDQPGLSIRSVLELLRICKGKENIAYTLKISMLEIYNDTLNDLLSVNSTGPLEIRTQGKLISVPGLTHVQVDTEDDVWNFMDTVDKNRKPGSTKMTAESCALVSLLLFTCDLPLSSSRSHLMFTATVEGTDRVSGVTSCGTLTVCDLAGPKHTSKTEAKGQSLMEAAAINKSLTSLRQVFSALKSNALHVPFRNCKLTHLLQPCLSGEAQCCVFVNVNPDVNNMADTLHTLQFGSTLRQIVLGKTTQHMKNAKAEK
ncbi:hypothetical protein DPEC_G00163090 [Dallia pectoralis]|uniref:Uncharacterized protein n=1 Tax=Dallia pectoralis TaxID=75939 RepID=A0ACC2GGG8_DALPE|nr:hypothetical protein DPEC_G00163090 [Dallia pectoralis]